MLGLRRPTDTSKTELIFCPAEQYGGDPFLQYGSCCTDAEEDVVEAKFLEAGNGTLSSGCAVLYKEVGEDDTAAGDAFETPTKDRLLTCRTTLVSPPFGMIENTRANAERRRILPFFNKLHA